MYHKLIKLVTGEDLIVTTDDPCDSFISKEFIDVVDPVVVRLMKYPKGGMVVEAYIMQPWIKLAKSDVMRIPTKNIVVAVDIEEKVKVQYQVYITQYEEYKNQTTNVGTEDDADFDEYDEDESIDDFLRHLTGEDEEDNDDESLEPRILH